MICRNCGLETPSEGTYCINCGATLSNTEQEPAYNNNDQENDINLLRREILRLQQLVNSLNVRLSSIEREHGILPVDFEPAEPESPVEKQVFQTPEEEPEVHEAMVAEEIAEAVPFVETWISPVEPGWLHELYQRRGADSHR